MTITGLGITMGIFAEIYFIRCRLGRGDRYKLWLPKGMSRHSICSQQCFTLPFKAVLPDSDVLDLKRRCRLTCVLWYLGGFRKVSDGDIDSHAWE
jgi:hypothetical protein